MCDNNEAPKTPKPRKRPLMLLPGSLVGPSENDGLMSDDDSEQSQKLSINEIVSILDPFCRLPFKLSKEEALYLKFCQCLRFWTPSFMQGA